MTYDLLYSKIRQLGPDPGPVPEIERLHYFIKKTISKYICKNNKFFWLYIYFLEIESDNKIATCKNFYLSNFFCFLIFRDRDRDRDRNRFLPIN